MTESAQVAAARAEVERRRGRLMGAAHQLQERLSPGRITRDAWQGAKEKGADLAEDAVDAVRARPIAATGAVAALALFLAREPLMDLAGKLMDGVGKKRTARKSRKARPSHTEKVE